ncbi:MAG: hypothetical protein H0W06_05355 [Chloroflexia bacterium]|nr:hypothetical protein [Chloroflexia bacterium]
MPNRTTSPARTVTVIALVAIAAGIVIQIAAGIDFPTIPPGLFVTLVPAALIAFTSWRWTPILGTVVGVMLIVGFFLSGETDRAFDPSPLGGLVGLWLMFVAEVVAIVAGIIATMRNYRTSNR